MQISKFFINYLQKNNKFGSIIDNRPRVDVISADEIYQQRHATYIYRACLCVILSVGVIAYSGMRKLMTSCSTLTLRGAMGLFIRRPSTLTSDWDISSKVTSRVR